MDIIVLIKQVPDLAEELEINSEGTDLDREYLTVVMNEFCEQALEEAVLLKEAAGGTVTAVTMDGEEAENILFTAAAKGADNLVKVTGDFEDSALDSHALSAIYAEVLAGRSYDVIMTGVQAVDDLDGQLGPLLASRLNLPHVSVVAGVTPDDEGLVVTQEFGGGLTAELAVKTPCVLGVQAAKQSPRYAPVSKVRAMKQEKTIEDAEAPAVETPRLKVRAMRTPESSSHAEMLTGSTDDVAEKVVALLRERGLVKA
ncbi:MAG TPA: electron transfer flavoprotein subunit beta/FixA family protein [Actinomycetota bacterium]|nr:electron transfer flavoprotein subunit beta/FixA family protein [Actinomycetota bacterium]